VDHLTFEELSNMIVSTLSKSIYSPDHHEISKTVKGQEYHVFFVVPQTSESFSKKYANIKLATDAERIMEEIDSMGEEDYCDDGNTLLYGMPSLAPRPPNLTA
jgi:hypothetical protein